MLTIGQAIASYQRSLNSADSPFDRWYFAKQPDAVSDSIKRGFVLFEGKGGCGGCHTIEQDYALFTDNRMHNTGIGYRESMQEMPEKQNIQLAPGVFIEVDQQHLSSISEAKAGDLGRYEVTQETHRADGNIRHLACVISL